MHESGLIEDLIRKVERLVRAHGGRRATAIRVRLGPLALIEPEHLREHFEMAAVGTLAEGAALSVVTAGIDDPDPLAVILESVEIEIE